MMVFKKLQEKHAAAQYRAFTNTFYHSILLHLNRLSRHIKTSRLDMLRIEISSILYLKPQKGDNFFRQYLMTIKRFYFHLALFIKECLRDTNKRLDDNEKKEVAQMGLKIHDELNNMLEGL